MGDKVFLTYEEQIKKLKEKNLTIDDEEYAISKLKKLSYFNLINGYKKPFKEDDGNYKSGTKFEDIISLYEFDDKLRKIFLKNILIVEIHIKSLISYHFCNEFGDCQDEYLNPLNYNEQSKYKKQINELVSKLDEILKNPDKVRYIKHQQDQHSNVPLWVLVKALTIGNLSKLYSSQKDSIKSRVSMELPVIKENQIEAMLDILTRYRNVCAHNERLFDFKYKKKKVRTTNVHKYYNLNQKEYVPTNLFDIVIFLKYLLSEDDFNNFVYEIGQAINELIMATNQIEQNKILRLMGFPKNWLNINKLYK